MLNTTFNYTAASREFIGKAWEYLAVDDRRQASEKGWGAAAEMVKAVAEERGWPHDTHRLLYDIVRNLEQETGNARLFLLFQMASGLHTNFYENWLHPANIRQSLHDVVELLALLEPLVETTPAP